MVLTVPQGPKVDVVGAMLVGGGLLEVLPTALEKVAGGPLMEEADLGPGVALWEAMTPTVASFAGRRCLTCHGH